MICRHHEILAENFLAQSCSDCLRTTLLITASQVLNESRFRLKLRQVLIL